MERFDVNLTDFRKNKSFRPNMLNFLSVTLGVILTPKNGLKNTGKAVCERQFALHRQQPENNKQNVDVVPLETFLRTPMGI